MELKEFVSSTLVGIINGVLDAQRAVGHTGGIVCPGTRNPDDTVAYLEDKPGKEHTVKVHKVQFDVAVTVSSQSEDNLGGGIAVLGINIGGKLKSGKEDSHVSRLQFEIPVSFPLANYFGPYADSLNWENLEKDDQKRRGS